MGGSGCDVLDQAQFQCISNLVNRSQCLLNKGPQTCQLTDYSCLCHDVVSIKAMGLFHACARVTNVGIDKLQSAVNARNCMNSRRRMDMLDLQAL